jgi:hypothetical protein
MEEKRPRGSMGAPSALPRQGRRVVDEDGDVQPTIRLLQDPFVAEAGMADPEQFGHGQGVPIPADVVVIALEWEAGVSKTRGHHRTADHIGPVGEAFKGVRALRESLLGPILEDCIYRRESESAVLQNVLVQEGVLERAVVESSSK